MVKKILMLIGGLFVAFIALALVLPTPDKAAPAAETPGTAPTAVPRPEPTWQTLKEWKGSGIKDTESFTTQTREWRVTWSTHSEPFPGAGVFQIFVHNDRDELVNLAANVTGVKSDNSIVRGPAGRYYLKINSGNVSWSVKVEELR
ncbi:MAG: hypothetical protein IPL75_11060 [Acidobacteria bacterium]|nr:hypothetical protein [Acidobacteriota bacterium]